jgi:hypothetical protein
VRRRAEREERLRQKIADCRTSAADVNRLIHEAEARFHGFHEAVSTDSDTWPKANDELLRAIMAMQSAHAHWHDCSRTIGGDARRLPLTINVSEVREWWTLQAGFRYMGAVLSQSYVTTSLLFGDEEEIALAGQASAYAWERWPTAESGVADALRGHVPDPDGLLKFMELAPYRVEIEKFTADWSEAAHDLRTDEVESMEDGKFLMSPVALQWQHEARQQMQRELAGTPIPGEPSFKKFDDWERFRLSGAEAADAD